jgi:hypothetical protein
MAFGKVDPVEVIGMSADELKGKLDSAASKDDLKAVTDGQTALQNTLTSLQQSIESLKSKPKDDSGSEGDLDFLADPDKVLNSRLKPLTDQTYANTIMLQHDAARKAHPRDFDRWGTEIVKKMGELSADQQSDPRVWKAMVLMVRGEHADQIERDGATGQFGFLEPVSAGLRPDPKNNENLSPAEREMVKTLSPFGVTADKYKRGKQRLVESRAARLGRFAQVEG